MEVSDDDEEIIELNELQTNSKTINNQEKNTSKSSLKKIKWNSIKYSVDSISQIVDSESSQSFYNKYAMNESNNNEKEIEKEKEEEKNVEENKDINNNKYNNDNTPLNIPETEFIYTFTWEEGGNEVKIIGSFTDWKESYIMKKDLNDNVYKTSLPLHNKIYYYKFIVDGEWKFSQIQPTKKDNDGNINNVLDLTNFIFNYDSPKANDDTKIKEEKKKSSKKNIKKKKSSKLNTNTNNEKKKNLKIKKTKKEYNCDKSEMELMSEPPNNSIIGKPFYLNIESKMNKIGNKFFYDFYPKKNYTSHKSYINLNGYRHNILEHIILLKNLKKSFNIKVGISQRYRGKATTIIYYNSFSKENDLLMN